MQEVQAGDLGAVRSAQTEPTSDSELPALTISLEKVCFVIVKAREFNAKDAVTERDAVSNPMDG